MAERFQWTTFGIDDSPGSAVAPVSRGVRILRGVTVAFQTTVAGGGAWTDVPILPGNHRPQSSVTASGSISTQVLDVANGYPTTSTIRVRTQTGGAAVTLQSGEFLILAGGPALTYFWDPAGENPEPRPPATTDPNLTYTDPNTGSLDEWITEGEVLLEVIKGGSVSYRVGGIGPNRPSCEVNVLDYATPAQAIRMAPPGARIYFPAGIYVAPVNGFGVNKQLEIAGDVSGDGSSGNYQGTIIRPASASDPCFAFGSGADGSFIHDLQLNVPSGMSHTGAGFTTSNSVNGLTSGQTLSGVCISNVTVQGMGTGMALGQSGVTLRRILLERCFVRDCHGTGIVFTDVEVGSLTQCKTAANFGRGLHVSGGGCITVLGGSHNGNLGNGVTSGATSFGQIHFDGSKSPVVLGVRLLNFKQSSDAGVCLDHCRGGRIAACYCENASAVSGDGTAGIRLRDVRGFTVGTCTHKYVGLVLHVQASTFSGGSGFEGCRGIQLQAQSVIPVGSPSYFYSTSIAREELDSSASGTAGNFEVFGSLVAGSSGTFPANAILGIVLPKVKAAEFSSARGSDALAATLAYDSTNHAVRFKDSTGTWRSASSGT